MQRGLFITFEGSEGCGKTTQIRCLAARFETAGWPAILTREPGGTALGEEIRHLLQFSEKGAAMTPECELLLFTASRAQLVREVIEPALRGGVSVIADRFLDSTTVYQGVARRLAPHAVKFVNDFAVGACRPDATFVLDLEARLAVARLRARASTPDRMERQPLEFYEAVRHGYLTLARDEPGRIHVIDAAKAEAEIAEEVWRIVHATREILGEHK